MKSILFASAIALAVTTGVASAATLDAVNTPEQTVAPTQMQATHPFYAGNVANETTGYATPSASNPTGLVERGPNDEIALFPPSNNGR